MNGYTVTIDGMEFLLSGGDFPLLYDLSSPGEPGLAPDDTCRLRVEQGSDEALAVMAVAGFVFDDCR